jgi:7-keto-8-aminopelargonate synthetase-like enzyme
VAGLLAAALFERGINVMPIIYPAVEEGAARLRFFLSCAHSEDGVRQALDATAEELPRARQQAERLAAGGR